MSPQALALSFVRFDGAVYLYGLLVTQALLTCFCALIVLELYGLVLRDLTGVASAFAALPQDLLGRRDTEIATASSTREDSA